MRTRLALVAAALGALSLAAPSALAAPAPATLDGKKVSKLQLIADAKTQANAADIASSTRVQCEDPRCSALPFVYAPAKGASGDVLFTVTWTNPGSDIDLYVVEQAKSSRVKVANCGGSGGTSEKVFLPAGTLKKGKTYALIADFFLTSGEKVTSTVELGAPNTVSTTFPAQTDTVSVNCTR